MREVGYMGKLWDGWYRPTLGRVRLVCWLCKRHGHWKNDCLVKKKNKKKHKIRIAP